MARRKHNFGAEETGPGGFMDAQSSSAIQLLQAIAEAHKALEEFARRLRVRPGVANAGLCPFSPKANCFGEYNSDLSFVYYSGGDFGVASVLDNGVAIDWWLELGWNESNWRLEYNVHRNDGDEDGSHVAIAFPELKTTSLTGLIEGLNTALDELFTTATDDAFFS